MSSDTDPTTRLLKFISESVSEKKRSILQDCTEEQYEIYERTWIKQISKNTALAQFGSKQFRIKIEEV